MQKFKNIVRIGTLYVLTLLLVGGAPLVAMADSTTPATPPATTDTTASAPVTPVNPTITTPTAPTAPQPAAPTPPQPKETYTFNPVTKHWDSNVWTFDPVSNTYVPTPQPVAAAPAPTSSTATDPSSTSGSGTGSGQNTINGTQNGSATINGTTNVNAQNGVQSNATTGNAAVTQNTNAGNATTGNAAAVTTLINNVGSSLAGGSNVASFTSNINGDVHGDIMIYPMLLQALLQAASQPSSTKVNSTNNNQLTNDVNLNATSGNALVAANTNAGNATSGSANTVANVVNILNSVIAANQSFVGTINIYGSLDGDILVAPDFISQLLASNAGGTTANTTGTSTLKVNNADTQAIVNNVTLGANSGQATVADNTKAGSATTGNASTNVTLLNLTGHQIVASNSMLVFVNVLGKWVGMIVDAPSGATAAALGNGVVSNTTATTDQTINAKTNNQITNNINLNSQSGSATVKDNTTGGNATTGNATASANISNISNSSFGLSNWFGILFINVFGLWNGSFGVDTSAGNGTTSATPTTGQNGQPITPQVFQFIPQSAKTGAHHSTHTQQNYAGVGSAGTPPPASDPAATTTPASSASPTTPLVAKAPATNAVTANTSMNVIPLAIVMIGIGGAMVGFRNILGLVQRRFNIVQRTH